MTANMPTIVAQGWSKCGSQGVSRRRSSEHWQSAATKAYLEARGPVDLELDLEGFLVLEPSSVSSSFVLLLRAELRLVVF